MKFLLRRVAGRSLFACLGYLLILVLSAWIAGAWVHPAVKLDVRVVMALLFGGALTVTALVWKDFRDWGNLQLARVRGRCIHLVLACAGGVAFHLCYVLLSNLDVGRIAGWNLDGKFIFSSILLSSIVAPLIEEFFFRGVAIWKSVGKEALVSAIVASSMFAAVHPDRWLSVFAFSLVASFIYVRLGFLACYVFHCSYNIANFVFLLVFSQLNQGA